jgi:hypothetical protein
VWRCGRCAIVVICGCAGCLLYSVHNQCVDTCKCLHVFFVVFVYCVQDCVTKLSSVNNGAPQQPTSRQLATASEFDQAWSGFIQGRSEIPVCLNSFSMKSEFITNLLMCPWFCKTVKHLRKIYTLGNLLLNIALGNYSFTSHISYSNQYLEFQTTLRTVFV